MIKLSQRFLMNVLMKNQNKPSIFKRPTILHHGRWIHPQERAKHFPKAKSLSKYIVHSSPWVLLYLSKKQKPRPHHKNMINVLIKNISHHMLPKKLRWNQRLIISNAKKPHFAKAKSLSRYLIKYPGY